MKPGKVFLNALHRQPVPRPATGSVTSIVTEDLQEEVGIEFPQAHLDAEEMAGLAGAGHTLLGFDNVMPLFSVWHEASALGCKVNWGDKGHMPDCRNPLYSIDDAIQIPNDLLNRSGCSVPLEAIRILRKRFGDEIAIAGKIFGPWTLSYHLFGTEEFLINTLLKPDTVRRVLDTLKEVSVVFGRAQFEAGADALCLGDHATRDLCSPEAYRDFLQDIHEELQERIPGPLVLHICGDTSDRICYIRETSIPCFHFDSSVPSALARELAGERLSLMGGTSNYSVIKDGTCDDVVRDVGDKISHGIDIIGPECAVPLNASYRNLKVLAEETKRHVHPSKDK